jgi:hypothetical protein
LPDPDLEASAHQRLDAALPPKRTGTPTAKAVKPQSGGPAERSRFGNVTAATNPKDLGIEYRRGRDDLGVRGRVWVTKARRSKLGGFGRQLNATISTAPYPIRRIIMPEKYTRS